MASLTHSQWVWFCEAHGAPCGPRPRAGRFATHPPFVLPRWAPSSPGPQCLAPARSVIPRPAQRTKAPSAGGWRRGSVFPIRFMDATSEEPEALAAPVPSLRLRVKSSSPSAWLCHSCLRLRRRLQGLGLVSFPVDKRVGPSHIKISLLGLSGLKLSFLTHTKYKAVCACPVVLLCSARHPLPMHRRFTRSPR